MVLSNLSYVSSLIHHSTTNVASLQGFLNRANELFKTSLFLKPSNDFPSQSKHRVSLIGQHKAVQSGPRISPHFIHCMQPPCFSLKIPGLLLHQGLGISSSLDMRLSSPRCYMDYSSPSLGICSNAIFSLRPYVTTQFRTIISFSPDPKCHPPSFSSPLPCSSLISTYFNVFIVMIFPLEYKPKEGRDFYLVSSVPEAITRHRAGA